MLQKLSVYMDYYITQVCMKYDFYIDYAIEETPQYNKSLVPKGQIVGIKELCYLWKDIHIDSFEEFTSKENVVITDMGEDWERHKFAQRFRMEYRGIYNWFWKFKDRINLSYKL